MRLSKDCTVHGSFLSGGRVGIDLATGRAMKTFIHIALVLVATAVPAHAQQLTLLGQSSQQTAIARPPRPFTTTGTSGGSGVGLEISLSATGR
jgi:hypothetical protein